MVRRLRAHRTPTGRPVSGRAPLEGRRPAGRGRFWRLLLRRRRLLAGLLAAAACGVAVQALLPAGAETTRLVVAGADLPAGHLLEAGDVRITAIPAGADPPGALGEEALAVGERLAVPVRTGAALTETLFVGPGLLAAAPEGTSAVPLRPADPAAAVLLSPGVLVDVLLAPAAGFEEPAGATVLAAGVPVLWISGGDGPGDGSGGGSGGGGPGGSWPGAGSPDTGLVVVAASPAEAVALAGAADRGTLHLVLSGGPQPPPG